MSRYEWESGTIVLPTAEVTAVKRAVRNAADAHRRRLYEEAQRFWAALPRRFRVDAGRYERAVGAFLYGPDGRLDDAPADLPRWPGVAARNGESFVDDLHRLLLPYGAERPRRVRRDDLATVCPVPAGAGPSYRCGEATLRFESRTAHWDVPSNNHACETARRHPVAAAFFAALGRVRWTRGSGGEIVGNDEYNRDVDYEGGGANYVVERYGLTQLRRLSLR